LLRDGAVVLAMMDAVEPAALDPKPLRLPAAELGWIGTGSAGLPTCEGRRAEFLILDDGVEDDWKIEKYAVTYPRQEARGRTKRILTEACSAAVAEQIARWM
jgi:hypothetical protein